MRVYQFHHYGIEIIRVLQHDSFPVPATIEEHSYQKLTFKKKSETLKSNYLGCKNVLDLILENNLNSLGI